MKRVLGAILFIVIWHLASLCTTPIFIPSPINVGYALIDLFQTGQLQMGLVYSFSRITTAAVLSMLVAIPVALMIYGVSSIKEIVMPGVSMLRFIPVTAFSPLLILWFGIDETMKISFLFLATFVYLLPSVLLCFDEVPTDLIDTGKTIGMTKLEIIMEILLPSALPSICNTFLMMYGIGWTYCAIVEATNARYGLGFIINVSAARGRTSVTFASIVIIMVFSFFIDKLGKCLIKKVFKWRFYNDTIE